MATLTGRFFQPAEMPASAAPSVTRYGYVAAQTFLKGAVLIFGTAGNVGLVQEAGATPATGIVGIALESPASTPGHAVSFDATVIARTGVVDAVSVAAANRLTIFTGRMVNGGTDPVTPAATDIGVKYGVIKDANGVWAVDQSNTTQVPVIIVDIDIANNIVMFKFTEAALAIP